ncbi:hypothetical protein DL765_009271 [Monosporascus sp. GIB2]|nr:hypothetical protein DL765_009271 [Monosporascus sp. GIB2]
MAPNTILLHQHNQSFKFLALTRNTTFLKAQVLATAHPALDLHVMDGYAHDPDPIFAAHPGHRRRLRRAGVKRFVFSSLDRSCGEHSWDDPTPASYFAENFHIEAYLGLHGEPGPDVLLRSLVRERLGHYAGRHAAAAHQPAGRGTLPRGGAARSLVTLVMGKNIREPRNRARGRLADAGWGARTVYARVAGDRSQLTQAWWLVGRGMRWAIGAVGRMFDWLEVVGYGVEVAALRAAEPGLQDFETLLRESSGFPFSAKVQEGA